MYRSQEKRQRSYIFYNEATPCVCQEIILELETKEQNMGGQWGLLSLINIGIKTRTLGEDKGFYLPGAEVTYNFLERSRPRFSCLVFQALANDCSTAARPCSPQFPGVQAAEPLDLLHPCPGDPGAAPAAGLPERAPGGTLGLSAVLHPSAAGRKIPASLPVPAAGH